MRVPRGKPAKVRREPVEELAEFMNFNLSHHVLYKPQLRGKAVKTVVGTFDPNLTCEERHEYGTTAEPLSAEEFVKAFRKLGCFEKWGGPLLAPWYGPVKPREMATEVACVQRALGFILQPLVTAQNSHELTIGIER